MSINNCDKTGFHATKEKKISHVAIRLMKIHHHATYQVARKINVLKSTLGNYLVEIKRQKKRGTSKFVIRYT